MKTYLFAAALASIAIGGTACAAQDSWEGRPRGGGMMMRADTNHDGVVTREEAIAEAAARFDRMDANHDGKLDRTEMANMREMATERRADQTPPPSPPPGEQ